MTPRQQAAVDYAKTVDTSLSPMAFADKIKVAVRFGQRDEAQRAAKLVEAAHYAKQFFVVSAPYMKDEIMKQDARESLDKLIDALAAYEKGEI